MNEPGEAGSSWLLDQQQSSRSSNIANPTSDPLSPSATSPTGDAAQSNYSDSTHSDSTHSDSDPPDSDPPEAISEQTSELGLLFYRYPLVGILLAWVAGIGLASSEMVSSSTCIWVAIGATAAFLLVSCGLTASYLWARALLVTVATIASSAWYSLAFVPPTYDSLSALAMRKSQPIALRGLVVESAVWSPNPYHRPSEPDSEPWSTQWLVHWESLREHEQWQPIQCRSRLSTKGRIHHVLPGDRIEVFGSMEAISKPTNPGMPDFAKRAAVEGQFVSVLTDDSSQNNLIESTNLRPFSRLPCLAFRLVYSAILRSVFFAHV